jgi:hypothetical protein
MQEAVQDIATNGGEDLIGNIQDTEGVKLGVQDNI